jgi:hypothetical protein
MGATLGTAIFGTIMASRMKSEIPKYLPAEALDGSQAEQFSGGSGVGAVLDPSALVQLPPDIAIGIREGLAAAMHTVFVAGLPILAVAFLASLFIKELPLRNTAFADQDAGKEMLRSANQSAPEGVHGWAQAANGVEGKLLLTGITLEYLARKIESANGEFPNLVAAASALAPDGLNGSGTPHERAQLYAREVIRPLALQTMLTATGAGPLMKNRIMSRRVL